MRTWPWVAAAFVGGLAALVLAPVLTALLAGPLLAGALAVSLARDQRVLDRFFLQPKSGSSQPSWPSWAAWACS